MFGFLLGFNARLGRLHFVLATVGLAVLVVLVMVAMISAGLRPPAGLGTGSLPPLLVAAGLVILLWAWASLNLHAMRIRDIGWNPALVIPGWILAELVDRLIATKFPALAVSASHHGTMAGALINLVLGLVLVFWPGGEPHGAAPGRDDDRPSWETPRDGAPRVPIPAIRAQFGRRA
jgi:uncharacterized membrane protein YhaH (DUF805 family)